MVILSIVVAMIKIAMLFYLAFFMVWFVVSPMLAIAMLKSTIQSWGMLFKSAKQQITINVLRWKLNKVQKSQGFTHVIKLRKV